MKRFIFYCISFCSFCSCNVSKTIDLDNKYLIYSKTIKNDAFFWAPFFTCTSGNTRVESYYKFNDWYSMYDLDSSKTVDIQNSARVFQIKQEHDGLHYQFSVGNVNYSELRYSLTKGDTLFFNKRSSVIFGVMESVFTGKDSTLLFYNNKISCWKYTERDFVPNKGWLVYEKWVDKKNYLPILVTESLHKFGNDSLLNRNTYILRAFIDKNQVKSKEWRE